jgi:membrane-associated HD superfamily phosphohydrolase
MKYSQRFRYGNLTQMYSKFREMFRKRMKQKEEGTVQRHFGAAAREIEAERARQRAETEKSQAVHLPFAVSWKDPEHEKKKVEQLFAAFREAKSRAGEDIDALTMEAFQKFVRQKTIELKKQKDVHEVEYIVSLEENHARLKARVKS